HARLRCASRAGVEGVDESEADPSLVGAEEIHHGRGEDGRPTWRDLAIRPAGRRGERVRFPRGIPGSRAFRTNRRNLRIRGDAGTCPRRERRVRGDPGQDEGHAEVRLRADLKYTTVVEKMDVRPGGTWRFVQRDAEGNEFGFHGEYREVVPFERIVETFEFEGMPGHVLVESAVFEEIRGKTKVTQRSVFATVEDLEGMLASGMEEGARETIERFAE